MQDAHSHDKIRMSCVVEQRRDLERVNDELGRVGRAPLLAMSSLSKRECPLCEGQRLQERRCAETVELSCHPGN